METPKSTLHEPLKFFHWMFIENNFKNYKANFFYQYEIEDYHFELYKVDKEKEVVYEDRLNDRGEWIVNPIYFIKVLGQKLYSEAIIAQRTITSAIADITFQGISPIPFIQLQTGIINDIQEKSQAYTYKYPFIATVINQIKEHIESQSNYLVGGKASPSQSNSKAFVYQGNNPALNKMKEYLEEKNLINMTDDFIKIFTGKPFEKKINWISYNNAFHYFIDKLSECERIDFNRDEKWKIAVRCFTIKDEPIDNKDIKSNNKLPAQKTKDIIEKAIKNLNW